MDGVDDDTRGSYFFDSFASQSSGYIGLEPDGAIPELFEDGFENGNYLAWSSSLTEGGSLEVNSQAAIDGEYGLQTTISTMNSVYLRNNSTPTMEYHARFYFDPNSISMADGDEHTILKLEDEEGWIVARIDFSYQDDDYWVRSVAMLDDDEEFIGDWVMLSDDQHKIEMGWYASGEPEYDEGFVVFWLDDEIQYYLDYLDNDTLRTTTVKMGAVEGVDDDTRGSYYFDAFVSGRNGDIGMLMPGNIFLGMVDSEAQSQQLLVGLEAARKTLAAPAPVQTATSLAAAQQSQLITTTVVISYTYDPLNRLTAADYDGGMYFHYTYDAVGNRLVEATNVLTNTYSYDDANRMIYFNSVNYTWDDNGNLLSDGVNSYSYDRANRLIEVSGVGVDVSYAYNGLGDRLSETANSQTTHYTMDLNAGLTQVLQDGTNTYQYGLDRIAQYSANGPEYYLADALGSVRQMVDANGNVTMGRMYKPYGGVLSSTGSGATSYGYTGEWVDSSTGDVYLRARWYAPGQGRFLTKDTWEGDAYVPMSFNLWNYVQSNPINYQDPTGNDRYAPSGRTPCSIGIGGGWTHWNVITRVDEAERYVYHTANPMDTYVAAGIAIQCAGTDFPKDPWSSMGIAQVSYPQAETEWEQEVKDGEGLVRSYGLRKRCSNGELERALDPKNPRDAVELMKRRIQMVIDNCKGKGKDCNHTDRYIAAGLAQNGSGFTHINMRKIPDLTSKSKKEFNNPLVNKEWFDYFNDNKKIDTVVQLIRFDLVINELRSRRWIVPYIDTHAIEILKNLQGDR